MYDTNNYFPEQLESMVVEKGRSLYPNKDYSDLTNEEKDKVWDQVKKDKLKWELNVTNSTTDSDSFIEISLSEDWQRLGIYQLGDIVQFDGKLWESVQNENFNHSPSAEIQNSGKNWAVTTSRIVRIGTSSVQALRLGFIIQVPTEGFFQTNLLRSNIHLMSC